MKHSKQDELRSRSEASITSEEMRRYAEAMTK
jgi:hypothetical protein